MPLHRCVRCGEVRPTALVTFKANVSLIFRRRQSEFCGYVCFSCMTKEFFSFEVTTLVGTWWGIIGCILGPYFIIINVCEYCAGSFVILRHMLTENK